VIFAEVACSSRVPHPDNNLIVRIAEPRDSIAGAVCEEVASVC
jgi:hypothetical protein